MTDILKGIIIGVIASAIFAFLGLIINRLIIPWIQNLFIDGPNLSGEWNIYYSQNEDSKSVGHFSFKQFGRRIRGTAKLLKNRSGDDVTRDLIFRGSFRGGQVIGLYEDVLYKGYIVGVVLLKFRKKNEFTGKAMYCHPNQIELNSYDIFIKRAE